MWKLVAATNQKKKSIFSSCRNESSFSVALKKWKQKISCRQNFSRNIYVNSAVWHRFPKFWDHFRVWNFLFCFYSTPRIFCFCKTLTLFIDKHSSVVFYDYFFISLLINFFLISKNIRKFKISQESDCESQIKSLSCVWWSKINWRLFFSLNCSLDSIFFFVVYSKQIEMK